MSFIRRRRWTGERLAALEADYRNLDMSLVEMGKKWGTSPGRICQLATLHNWPARYFRGIAKYDKRLTYLMNRKARIKAEITRLNHEITQIDRKLFAIKTFTGSLNARANLSASDLPD